jgi:hypothetical protein
MIRLLSLYALLLLFNLFILFIFGLRFRVLPVVEGFKNGSGVVISYPCVTLPSLLPGVGL